MRDPCRVVRVPVRYKAFLSVDLRTPARRVAESQVPPNVLARIGCRVSIRVLFHK
jgi:hypothetical protein